MIFLTADQFDKNHPQLSQSEVKTFTPEHVDILEIHLTREIRPLHHNHGHPKRVPDRIRHERATTGCHRHVHRLAFTLDISRSAGMLHRKGVQQVLGGFVVVAEVDARDCQVIPVKEEDKAKLESAVK